MKQVRIRESAFNACERNGTALPFSVCMSYISEQISKYNQQTECPISRVYLGYEFCEKMFLMSDLKDLCLKAAELCRHGYTVSFVLPVMHESSVFFIKQLITKLDHLKLIDEWIVNDLGTLVLIREELNIHTDIVLGRLFDKTIREPRIDILQNQKVREHFDLLQPEDWSSEQLRFLQSRFGIKAAETDTFPDGVLCLENYGIPYHVHYPDIYISSAAYCEWTGSEDDDAFLLGSHCGMECLRYGQYIQNGDRNPLKKIGNVICYVQQKSVHDCVRGDIRIVFSER